MGKREINEIIKSEEITLENYKRKMEILKVKWIRLPSTCRFIDFLDHYLKEKEKFIRILKQWEK